MAAIKPFAALRPLPQLAAQICELPYDVMSSEEASKIAAGNALSFLHVSKPEIDFPPATDVYSPAVYAKAGENFRGLISSGALRQDPQACFYLYRQVMGQHSQTGLVAAASCEEYLKGQIIKHEHTRLDKEEDRVKHIEAVDAQTGPVFLLYRRRQELDELFTRIKSEPPYVDFTAYDGVRHTAWVIADAPEIEFIQNQFAEIPALYIADGHHRCAAAARVFKSRRGAGHSAWFLSVIFPHNQVQILPYNRLVKDLNGMGRDSFLESLDSVFTVSRWGRPTPTRPHEVSLYLAKQWHTLHFRPKQTDSSDPVEKLDSALLQKHVLGPLLDIKDPRTSDRIQFVGGIRGTGELESRVRSSEYACAFSLFPTSVEELMAVADSGGVMPPKSTWFEPKLRDALFCHLI